jgi:uncharacterized protein YegP (UPF0339 family)
MKIAKNKKGMDLMSKFVIRAVNSGVKFDLKATNGQVIATSEVYDTRASCLRGIESVRKCAPVAGLENQPAESWEKVSHPKFEMYVDKGGEFRFRLKARNGKIIAISEGYTTRASCENGIDSVRKNAEIAEIE